MAAENEAIILEVMVISLLCSLTVDCFWSQVFWEAEREADEKAKVKREDRVLKQWTRLIQGLRIRQRLQEQYSTKSTKKEHIHHEEKGEDGSRAESPHVHGQFSPFFSSQDLGGYSIALIF